METITLVPHDPRWTVRFAKKAELLQDVFKDQHIIVEHIGSTSVKGLDAKPVIDILVGFKDFNADEIIKRIEALGYEHWREDTFKHVRLMFVKWSPERKRLVNIHATTVESDFWNDQIKFRDVLRTNPLLTQKYQVLKRKLSETYKNDPDGYTEAKTYFIRQVIASYKPDKVI